MTDKLILRTTRLRPKPDRIPLARASFGMMLPAPVFGAVVITTQPSNTPQIDPADTAVMATLDGAASSVSAQTFPVRSRQTALGTSFATSDSGRGFPP